MIDDRTLERAARSFIEDGPTAAPLHVVEEALLQIERIPQERDWLPWRLPKMTLQRRAAVLLALGALILVAAFALAGIGSPRGPAPTVAPTAAPSPTVVASPALQLTQLYTSPTYGYSVRYPVGWTVTSAVRLWPAGVGNSWGSGLNDELSLAGQMRFSAASQPLADGQTPEEWLADYAKPADPATLPTLTVAGATGVVTADGVRAAGGTISPGGRMFDLVVVSGDRAYNFNMDGQVDRAIFETLIASITLEPETIKTLPPIGSSAVSPWYGYSIALPSGWTVSFAQDHWRGFDNSPPAVDAIAVAGTDTTVTIASQPLGGQAFDEWLSAFHANTTANVPLGCDGGDPSTWRNVSIGAETGRWYQLCNAAEAVLELGGRAYVFSLANDTFDDASHLPVPLWLAVLEGVTLDPSAAVDGS